MIVVSSERPLHVSFMPRHRVTHPTCKPPFGSPMGVCRTMRAFLWSRHLEAKPSKNFTGPQNVQDPREVPHLESSFQNFKTNQSEFKHTNGQKSQENASCIQRVPFSLCPCFLTSFRGNGLCVCQTRIC